MHIHSNKPETEQTHSVADNISQKTRNSIAAKPLVNNRPEAARSSELQKITDTKTSADRSGIFQMKNIIQKNKKTTATPSTPVIQFEGKFVGQDDAWHLHIDIGDPHLQFRSDKRNRKDIGGRDVNGVYSTERLNEALNYLLEVIPTGEQRPKYKLKNEGTAGFNECYIWLCEVLGYDPNTEKSNRFTFQQSIDEWRENDRKNGRKVYE